MKKNYFVYAASFFFSLGGNILNLSIVYRLTDWFTFTPGQIGAYIAFGSLFYFAGCNLYHRFGSSFDPIKVFPAASFLVFIAAAFLSLGKSQSIVYVSYWVLQISSGFFWPPVMAWLTAGLNEKEMNREIGLFNRSWMAASILGPLVAGALYHWNSGVNFFLLSFAYFMVVFFIYMMHRYCKKHGVSLNEAGQGQTGAKVPETAIASNTPLDTAPDKRYSPQNTAIDKKLDLYRYKGWINAFSSTLFLGVLANIVPLHIRDGLGFTERSAGIMLFIRSTAGFLGFAILAKYTLWHFNHRWFYAVQSGLILCTMVLLFAGSRLYIFFGIVILAGLCNSGCYNNSIFYSGVTGKNPKKNMALHEIFLSIGSAAGAAGGGFFYQHSGFTGTFIALALVLLLGTGAQFLLDKRANRK